MRKKKGRKKSGSPRETGAVIKREKGLITTALVYPNRYRAGMSSLGFQTVYRAINDLKSVACERFFLPDRANEDGRLTSHETGKRLDQFDIIAFSISFENDYLNLAALLQQSGIPLRSSKRDNSHPLVIAGGVACFLNPEPLAPFIDCFLLGESEVLITEFFDSYSPDLPKDQFLEKIVSEMTGAYVPAFYSPVYTGDEKRFGGMTPVRKGIPGVVKVARLGTLENTTTTSKILSSDTAFKDILLIETGRGCSHGCRFCSAGFIYRPPRFYPEKRLIAALGDAKKRTDKVGLVSTAVSDHPDINRVCAKGIGEGLKLSFSSLRADALTDPLIDSLVRSGVKTATIAPEAGSDRLRMVINKKIDEAEILTAVKRLVDAGILHIRLYFMVGLPFETDGDVEEIVVLTRRIRKVFLAASRKKRKIGTITLSVNPFIPKAFTPFQWSSMASETVLKKRLKLIREGLKLMPNVRVNVESLRIARINSLLSMGDRRTADLLEAALDLGWAGAVRRAKKKSGVDGTVFFPGYAPDDPLPWDFLDAGIKKVFLVREFQLAGQEKISPDCPMIPCNRCKICR